MVEWKRLGDIMTIVRGASPRPISNYITSDPNGVNWIKIGDVQPGAKYITCCNEKVTEEGAKKSRYLHSGDFILSNSMSFGRPYILRIDGCIHDGWIAMSDFEKHLSSGYLYEILNSDRVQSYWKMKANNGGAMTNLNSDIVKDTLIPIPSLSEQKRIVGILDTFTDSIENLKQQIAQRRKQYEFYRDQLLDLKGKDGVEMKTLGEVCGIYDGTHQTPNYQEKGIKFVSVENIKDIYSSSKYISLDDYQNNYKTKPKMGDVLMTRIGDVGSCAVIDRNEPIAYYVSLALIRPFSNMALSNYIKYILESKTGRIELRKRTLLTAVPLKINLGDIGKIILPFPDLFKQTRIVSILDTFEASISNLEAQLEHRQKQYEYYRNKLLSFEKEEH